MRLGKFLGRQECRHCGESFAVYGRRPRRTFCSWACAQQGRVKPRYTRHCPHCGKGFLERAVCPRRFCSRACARASMRAPPVVRGCRYGPCGRQFVVKRHNLRAGAGWYCSIACAWLDQRRCVVVHCRLCGVAMRRTPSQATRRGSRHRYCSVEHMLLYQSGLTKKEREMSCRIRKKLSALSKLLRGRRKATGPASR